MLRHTALNIRPKHECLRMLEPLDICVILAVLVFLEPSLEELALLLVAVGLLHDVEELLLIPLLRDIPQIQVTHHRTLTALFRQSLRDRPLILPRLAHQLRLLL